MIKIVIKSARFEKSDENGDDDIQKAMILRQQLSRLLLGHKKRALAAQSDSAIDLLNNSAYNKTFQGNIISFQVIDTA